MKYAKIIGENEKAVESVKFDFLGLYRPGVILGKSNTPGALGYVMPLLNWQIGKLPPFDPISRVAWRDKTDAYSRSLMPYRLSDLVLFRLSKLEADEACGEAARIVPTPVVWPPPALSTGQHVGLAGYPNQLRALDLAGTMNPEACETPSLNEQSK